MADLLDLMQAPTRPVLEELGFMQWLLDQGYYHPRPIGAGRYAALRVFMFTCAIIVGRIGDEFGYDDRWCYHTLIDARIALEAWDGTGEPQGWHRHPGSGRRRPDGNAAAEYVNP